MRLNRKTGMSYIVMTLLCISLLMNITGCRKTTDAQNPVPTGPATSVNTGDTPVDSGSSDNQAGNTQGNDTAAPISDTASPSPAAEDPAGANAVTEAPQPKISDNGKPIADFDEFVNGEWRREQEAENTKSVTVFENQTRLVIDRVSDILKDTDVSALSEDDGLYKAIMIYRSLTNLDDIPDRLAEIRERIAPIEKVKSLEDLYKLCGEEEYSVFDMILRFEIYDDMYGKNMPYFRPVSLTASIRTALPGQETEEGKAGRERMLAYTNELGISEERTDEILENALMIASIIDEYPMKGIDGKYTSFYFDEEQMKTAGVSVPVFDILRKQNTLGESGYIMAGEKCCELLNRLYIPENAAQLRDYMLYYAIVTTFTISGYITEFDLPDYDYDRQVVTMMTDAAGDVLAQEYMNRYYTEEAAETLKTLTADLREAAKSVIYDADWLSAYSKEEARAKLMKMRICAGRNGYTNDFTDVGISNSAIENFFQTVYSNRRFRASQTAITGDYRRIFRCNMLEVNGYYYGGYNSYALTAGLLCDPMNMDAVNFEERLGYLGYTVAHEISHAFDPYSVDNDEYGYYSPWFRDEEINRYAENVRKIIYSIDGVEAGYGRKVSGQLTAAETFADIMAMQICLKLLSEQEDPDYNLFFRTLARQNAARFTEEGIEEALKDTHLPGNVRTNLVFGQFDKFYEIYDIDENSPYYVPEENRIRAF